MAHIQLKLNTNRKFPVVLILMQPVLLQMDVFLHLLYVHLMREVSRYWVIIHKCGEWISHLRDKIVISSSMVAFQRANLANKLVKDQRFTEPVP